MVSETWTGYSIVFGLNHTLICTEDQTTFIPNFNVIFFVEGI